MQLRQKFGAAGLSVAKLALRLGPSEQQQLTEQLVMQCVAKGQLQQALEVMCPVPVVQPHCATLLSPVCKRLLLEAAALCNCKWLMVASTS